MPVPKFKETSRKCNTLKVFKYNRTVNNVVIARNYACMQFIVLLHFINKLPTL